MSLGSEMGQQETGVMSNNHSQLSKATRDHYEENAWAMTLFNTEEVMISPDPEDRKRVEGEPAFIRPNPNDLYLGGFLAILHNIPLTREALLLRNKPLFDYGHEPQWWNGHAINLPKIVTVSDGQDADSDWDDVLHETQRLMAFMDSTKRAFGSSDSLAKIKSMSHMATDSEETVTRFMEAWATSALRADPENPLSAIFTSTAFNNLGNYGPESKELLIFEPNVDQATGRTLYEVLDSALWGDNPGEDLADSWLEHIAEVFVFRLDASEKPSPVGVDIPAVFYPDRYLSSCREIAREFRVKRLQIEGEFLKLAQLVEGYTFSQRSWRTMTNKELLERAAELINSNTPDQASDADPSSDTANAEASAETNRVSEELKAIASKIDIRLKGKHRHHHNVYTAH
jgi:hypothetical protein